MSIPDYTSRLTTAQVVVADGRVTVVSPQRFKVHAILMAEDPVPLIGYLTVMADGRVDITGPADESVGIALTIPDGVAALLRKADR